jgi:hypothetical protein
MVRDAFSRRRRFILRRPQAASRTRFAAAFVAVAVAGKRYIRVKIAAGFLSSTRQKPWALGRNFWQAKTGKGFHARKRTARLLSAFESPDSAESRAVANGFERQIAIGRGVRAKKVCCRSA